MHLQRDGGIAFAVLCIVMKKVKFDLGLSPSQTALDNDQTQAAIHVSLSG